MSLWFQISSSRYSITRTYIQKFSESYRMETRTVCLFWQNFLMHSKKCQCSWQTFLRSFCRYPQDQQDSTGLFTGFSTIFKLLTQTQTNWGKKRQPVPRQVWHYSQNLSEAGNACSEKLVRRYQAHDTENTPMHSSLGTHLVYFPSSTCW